MAMSKKKKQGWLFLAAAAGLGFFLYKRSQKEKEEKAVDTAVAKAEIANDAAKQTAQGDYIAIGGW